MTSPIPPFTLNLPLEQLADWLDRRFSALEATLMATAQQLSDALDALSASVTDFASDVSVTLQHQQQTLAQMQQTLDAALANDATDAATIADLRAQLAALGTGTDSALARISALNDAVRQADVAVNQPAP